MDERLTINHVEFYVQDAASAEDRFTATYGFRRLATSGSRDGADDHYAVALHQGGIHLVLTEPRSERHPAHTYLGEHGDGVVEIALRVGRTDPPHTSPRTVAGYGGIRYSFVEYDTDDPRVLRLPGFPQLDLPPNHQGTGLRAIDHFALCLRPGELETAVAHYASTLGLQVIFKERIVVGAQAMHSQVVQNTSGTLTLTLIEPDTTTEPGQIDSFLDHHGGPGVQHMAFSSDDVVGTVSELSRRGVEFLDIPDVYYKVLDEHMTLAAYDIESLRRYGILVDEDHDGQLFQIFTRSTHPRGTFFIEVIERLGARTFGSANIKALYEAVETEQTQSRARP